MFFQNQKRTIFNALARAGVSTPKHPDYRPLKTAPRAKGARLGLKNYYGKI